MKRWASAPKMHKHCGRGNCQPLAEQQSHKTRKSCIVHSAKVCDVSVMFVCVWKQVENKPLWICYVGFPLSGLVIWMLHLSVCFESRCSKEQAWRSMATSFSSAPTATETPPTSTSPRYPLSWPAEAAHSTAACHSGGSISVCTKSLVYNLKRGLFSHFHFIQSVVMATEVLKEDFLITVLKFQTCAFF